MSHNNHQGKQKNHSRPSRRELPPLPVKLDGGATIITVTPGDARDFPKLVQVVEPMGSAPSIPANTVHMSSDEVEMHDAETGLPGAPPGGPMPHEHQLGPDNSSNNNTGNSAGNNQQVDVTGMVEQPPTPRALEAKEEQTRSLDQLPPPPPHPNKRTFSRDQLPGHPDRGNRMSIHGPPENSLLAQHLDEIANLRMENASLQTGLRQVRRELAQVKANQDAEIARIQNAVFHTNNETRWQPMDDHTIKHELMGLQSAIARCAKDHAAQSSPKASTLNQELLRLLVEDLVRAGVTHLRSADEMVKILEMRSGARLCLTGLLTCKIFGRVFGSAFFFLRGGIERVLWQLSGVETPGQAPAKARKPGLGEDLESLYDILDTVEPREANIWRSDTVRLFMPHTSNQGAPAQKIRGFVREAVQEAATRFSKTFCNSTAAFYLRSSEPTAVNAFQDAIHKLYEEAAMLAIRLWAQRTKIECRYWEELHAERFGVGSRVLEAHASHKLDDSEDHRLDGKPVRMVLSPAVIRMGTDDAERYDTWQVWAKAVVLLAE